MSIAQENGTKSWGYVTGDFIDGIGYIGPENAVDNRKRKITITGSSFNPLVFSKKDVKSVDVVCASSDWIKFRICLKDGKVAVATFVDVNKDPMGVLTFEWWLADVMYKNASPVKKAAPKKAPAPVEEAKPVEEAPKAVEATPVVEEKPAEKPTPVVEKKPAAKKAPAKKKAEPKEEKKEEPKKEVKKAPAKKKEEPKKEEPKKEEKKAPAKKKAAPKKKPAPKKEVEEEIVVSEEVKRQVEKLEEDPWRLYQFAQQVMGAKSYQVAYYALKKMKAKMDADPKLAKNPEYKDVPKMLNSVKEEVEYNYKG